MSPSREISVLYVEDDEDYYFLVREFLDEITLGTYYVDWAPTYKEGRDKILRREHDVYLIDFRLGQESGLDLIKETRQAKINEPIILLTGQGDREIDIAAMEAGANDFLRKDEVSSSLLERAIRYTLNQHETTEKLKTSEERLQDFVETASDWIWEMDSDLRFSSISGATLSIDPAAVIGKTRMELSSSPTDTEEWERHLKALKEHQPFQNFELELSAPKGPSSFHETSGKPLFNQSGDFLGYRGTGRNITAERNIEQQLRQSQKMEAVGQLTGGIAHDFNNILHIINGNLELLHGEPQDQQTSSDKIPKMLQAVKRGARLTQQLLSFSRQQTLHPEVLKPNALVSETIALLERTLEEDITISFEVCEDVQPIFIDTSMLGNAILNLAVNSRDAMPAGGKLKIRMETIFYDNFTVAGKSNPISGPHSVISVIDTGKGIPEESITHVFEPFFTTKEVGKGSGLGLSMVYGFVEQSGGCVTIDSTPDKGTTVTLIFPITFEIENDGKGEIDSAVLMANGKEIILLVEDDSDVRETTAQVLNKLGYHVFQAKDGPNALEKLDYLSQNDVTVDLVLSDIVMPEGMDGFELAKKVDEKYPGTKMLLASGYPERRLQPQDSHAFSTQLLRKPFDLKTLSESLRTELDSA